MWRSPSSSGITRSFSVTMPTQRPASFTTGTPWSSCSPSSRATSSADVSGETVTGSSSMYSRTVGIQALTLPSEGVRDAVDHVPRDDVVRAADPGGRLDPGARVEERARSGGLEGAQALAEERADDAAQHVARARRRERGRGARADRRGLRVAGLRDDRVVALEEHDAAGPPCRFARVVEPAPLDRARIFFQEPAELAGVRGEDGGGFAVGQLLDRSCERVHPIRVDHERLVGRPYEALGERRGPVALPESRAQDHGSGPFGHLSDLG